MSPPIFRNVQIIDLPREARGKGDQSGGTWMVAGESILVKYPECCTNQRVFERSAIDKNGCTRMTCACGLDKPCRLTGWDTTTLRGGL